MRGWPVALAATAVLAGCGADDEPAPVRTENDDSPTLAPTDTPSATPAPAASATPPTATATAPTATAPSAPAPPPDAGVPEGHGGEDQEGGAGDEEAARVPVSLVVDGEGITPPVVSVPAFLALELRVRNDLPRPVRVRIARTSVAFRVPARSARARPAGGLGRGRYALDAGAAGRAELEVGVEPGP